MYPKIELHVHLEATVRPETLLEIARRNDYRLPATSATELAELYRYRDFDHFMAVWALTTNAMRHYDDFRQVVVDYTQEAARHGAVYIAGSSPRSSASGAESSGTRSSPATATALPRRASATTSRCA
jgi:adenosine deaminase